jgi:HK97 family phage major capsid protein
MGKENDDGTTTTPDPKEARQEAARAFVRDVLRDEGFSTEAITESVVSAVARGIAPLEERMKVLEAAGIQRLSGVHEAVPGLAGSKEAKAFNLLRAVRGSNSGNWDGAEIERDVLNAAADTDIYKRYMSTMTGASGGFWVPPEILAETIALLRPSTARARLGIQMRGPFTKWPIHIPKQTGDVSAYWVGEGDAATESAVTVGLIESRPKKIGTLTVVTKEDLAYADPSLEALIRESLLAQINLKKDLGFFEGTGASNEPIGMANVTGINTEAFVDPSAAGAEPTKTWAMLQAMISDLDDAYVTSEDRWKWAFNSKAKGAFMKIMDADKRPWWTWDPRLKASEQPLAGYPYVLSNKITTTSNITSLWLMDPYECIEAGWAGLMIEANPWAQGKYQKVEIYAFEMVDFICRQPKALCLMNDFDVSKYDGA